MSGYSLLTDCRPAGGSNSLGSLYRLTDPANALAEERYLFAILSRPFKFIGYMPIERMAGASYSFRRRVGTHIRQECSKIIQCVPVR